MAGLRTIPNFNLEVKLAVVSHPNVTSPLLTQVWKINKVPTSKQGSLAARKGSDVYNY